METFLTYFLPGILGSALGFFIMQWRSELTRSKNYRTRALKFEEFWIASQQEEMRLRFALDEAMLNKEMEPDKNELLEMYRSLGAPIPLELLEWERERNQMLTDVLAHLDSLTDQ